MNFIKAYYSGQAHTKEIITTDLFVCVYQANMPMYLDNLIDMIPDVRSRCALSRTQNTLAINILRMRNCGGS